MANATISGASGTKTGNFNLPITFATNVMGVVDSIFTITAVSGNGVTGVMFAVLPDDDMDAATYNVAFQIPANVEGQFRVTISGMVTPDGSSSPEAVMANSPVIFYDTTTDIAVTFGDAVYQSDGSIIVPVTFEENVVSPSKSVFPISHVYGDNSAGIEHYIVGEDANYDLVFLVPDSIKGGISIGADGYVLKESSEVWDNVVAVPKLLAFGYN